MIPSIAKLSSFYTLIVNKTGSGNGTVKSSLAEIICGDDWTEEYSKTTIIILTATADMGSNFGGCEKDCAVCGNDTTCKVF